MSKAVGFIVSAVAFAAAPWAAGLGGSILGVGVGSIASRLLMTVSMSALSVALQSKPKSGSSGGIKTSQTLTGETNPETIILGRYATAGQAICPPMSHGKDNRYLTHVIEVCSAPGATLDRLVINGTYVDLEATESSEYGRKVISGDLSGLVWVRYYDGSQTAADPMLLAKYGSAAERPWTADMVGRGLCYAILTFRYDQKKLNSVPSYLFELTGIPLYDPRQDSTAGGSGSQRWADRSTWAQSTNAMVGAYNIMRGITLPGGDVWGGKIATSDLPMSVWMAAMNAADLGVDDGAGGTEPQYRFGYEASVSDQPADVLEEILKAASAQVADIAGTWKVRAGAPNLPVMTLTDRDILVSKESMLDPFPSLDSNYNGITATFPNPDAVWQSKEAPARYNAEWEAADRFGRKTADVQLSAVPYGNQVQRLMCAWIEAERRFRTHKFTLPSFAAALEPLDCIAWTSLKNGYTSKQFEISETVDDLMTCAQGESLKEVDPSDYDWTGSMALPSVPSTPGYTAPAAEALAGWAVTGTTIKDASGTDRRVALLMSWDPDTIAEGIEWEIRLSGSTAVTPGSTQSVAAGSYRVSDGILSDTAYQARGRAIVSGRETAWTDWASATTDALSLSMADLSQDLQDWLEEMQSWIEGGLGDLPEEITDLAARITTEEAERVADAQLSAERWRETRETVRALQAQAVDLAAADHAAREEIRRGIYVELGTLRASYDEQIVTLADADRAAALKIETLEVTSADQTAQIQQVWQSQIAGDEAVTALITGLAVGNATQFDQAKIWYFDASAEGWTGSPSDPTVVAGGFIRPAAGTGTYIVSPSGLAVAGGTYSQVRLRLQKTGTPSWTGYLWWAAEGQAWDTARRVAVAEPLWSGDEGLLTIQPGWTGTIDRIRLDLDDAGAVDIDWVAIGRPAPGASSADLSTLQQAMTTADTALAQDIVQLQADLTATQGTATGAASAVSALDARVTETEDGLESVTESIDALQSAITDPATGNQALAEAIDQVAAETQTGDGSQLVQSTAIRALTSRLRALEAEGVETAARDHAGRQDLREYVASASQSLNTRIDASDEQIEIVAEAVTALQAAIPGLATADALQALQTIVTQQADSLSAQSTWLTSLQSALDSLTGVVGGKASASALTALTSRVNDVEGDISSQSASLTTLSNSLTTTNGNVSAAQAAAEAAATAAGAKGKVIYGSSTPAAADRLSQNLWIDTTGGANTPKRWNGNAWVAVTDKVATDAAAAAANAAALANTKADATALTALTSRVTAAEGNITAQADAQTALTSSVGKFSAEGLFRVTTEATLNGAQSRIGLAAAATTGEAAGARSAAMFLEAISGGKSRVGFVADQFVVQHDGANYAPFIVADGEVFINVARIRQATIDTLHLKNGSVTVFNAAGSAAVTTGNSETKLAASLTLATSLQAASVIGQVSFMTLYDPDKTSMANPRWWVEINGVLVGEITKNTAKNSPYERNRFIPISSVGISGSPITVNFYMSGGASVVWSNLWAQAAYR